MLVRVIPLQFLFHISFFLILISSLPVCCSGCNGVLSSFCSSVSSNSSSKCSFHLSIISSFLVSIFLFLYLCFSTSLILGFSYVSAFRKNVFGFLVPFSQQTLSMTFVYYLSLTLKLLFFYFVEHLSKATFFNFYFFRQTVYFGFYFLPLLVRVISLQPPFNSL